ncbi:ead/Ea22-like family protein [Lelliottia aquatilis]|nr:ead/Ea22-like family protein [Lelliottia aquatilis]NTZ48374.1 ead/Ea22-like family protein [Lelliottia aquatilis]
MSTNKQTLRQLAVDAKELAIIKRYTKGIEAQKKFIAAATPVTVLALLDELEAAEKRIAELEARPANPINFKENADADYCRGWAWNEVKKELASEAWTVGDNCTYYGFFCWGWDSRRQFNEQRGAGITVKGE